MVCMAAASDHSGTLPCARAQPHTTLPARIHPRAGVCFTRNPATGEKKLYGEYLQNAQGEDVVAGIRTPVDVVHVSSGWAGVACWWGYFAFVRGGGHPCRCRARGCGLVGSLRDWWCSCGLLPLLAHPYAATPALPACPPTQHNQHTTLTTYLRRADGGDLPPGLQGPGGQHQHAGEAHARHAGALLRGCFRVFTTLHPKWDLLSSNWGTHCASGSSAGARGWVGRLLGCTWMDGRRGNAPPAACHVAPWC